MQEGAYDALIPQLLKAYKQVRAGDPLEEGTLLGPLHTKDSKTRFLDGIEKIKAQVRIRPKFWFCLLELIACRGCFDRGAVSD